MKFNVEIDITWVDEEVGIDEAVKRELINKLSEQISDNFLADASAQMAQNASNLLKAKTELLINTVLEKPVTVSDGWQHKVEYESVYDMVEQRMTSLYQGKILGSKTCEKDPLLGKIQSYVDSSVKQMLADVERKIKTYSDSSATKALNDSKLFKAITDVVGT